uniref:ABC transporter permease n=1 Tax=Vibrio vulnificus TaxID=672 RepID=UPI0005F1033D
MISSLALLIGRRFSQAKQRNKMVSFISLSSTIGIAVGVAVIIIGLSAMNGFERELQSRVLSVIPHAELEGVRAPVENWQSVMTQAVANPKVVAAAPYVKFTGLVERGNKLKAVEVRGVEPDFEQAVSTMSQFIDQQAWSQFLPGQNQVIVGRGVANELGVDVGDYVTLLIPQTGESTQVQAPKRVRVKVAGV